jgi:hypothetical protein
MKFDSFCVAEAICHGSGNAKSRQLREVSAAESWVPALAIHFLGQIRACKLHFTAALDFAMLGLELKALPKQRLPYKSLVNETLATRWEGELVFAHSYDCQSTLTSEPSSCSRTSVCPYLFQG